jgi:hypothetical protein
MGAVSKIIIKLVDKKINAKNAAMVGSIAVLINEIRTGGAGATELFEKLKGWKEKLDEAKEAQEELKAKKEDLEKTLSLADTAAKAAEALEKTSVIGSALNPAAAAVGMVQKFVIEKAKEEIADLKGAIGGILPSALDKSKKTIERQRQKIDDFIKEHEEKKRLAEEKEKRNKV